MARAQSKRAPWQAHTPPTAPLPCLCLSPQTDQTPPLPALPSPTTCALFSRKHALGSPTRHPDPLPTLLALCLPQSRAQLSLTCSGKPVPAPPVCYGAAVSGPLGPRVGGELRSSWRSWSWFAFPTTLWSRKKRDHLPDMFARGH